jgi:hypothetical protein
MGKVFLLLLRHKLQKMKVQYIKSDISFREGQEYRNKRHRYFCRSHYFEMKYMVLTFQLNKYNIRYIRFESFTAVTMKNGVFLDVTPCGPCKNRPFGET